MTQHILEFLGIPYTGSNSLASGIAMDKDLSKLLYRRALPAKYRQHSNGDGGFSKIPRPHLH